MSVIRTATTLAHGAVSTAYGVARHPISTTAHTLGFAKGLAVGGLGLVRGQRPAEEATAPAPEARTAPPERVPVDVPEIEELPELIVIEADDTPGEAFHTEPKASSRDSEHGGQPGDREEADGYEEEIVLPGEALDEPDELVFTSETPTETLADPETVEALHAVAEASTTP